MKREIISPLLADTLRHRKRMVIFIAPDNDSFPENRPHFAPIVTVFRRDPMKPGKWFYSNLYDRTQQKHVYLTDKIFGIEIDWFNTYFKKSYSIMFTTAQRKGLRFLHNIDVFVADSFKKRFREAGIVNYLFLMLPDRFRGGMEFVGIGFLEETDAILGQQFLDAFTWNEDEHEYTLP